MKEFIKYIETVNLIEDLINEGFYDANNQILTHYISTIYNLLHAKSLIEDITYRRLYLDNIYNPDREHYYDIFNAEYAITDYGEIPEKLREAALITMKQFAEMRDADSRERKAISSCIRYSLGLLSGLLGNLEINPSMALLSNEDYYQGMKILFKD